MKSLFNDLKTGLEEAIYRERTSIRKLKIEMPREFTKDEIRNLRMNLMLSQSAFACILGVTKKAVEAWECGRTHPTGSALRLLSLLENETIKVEDLIEEND